MDERDGKKTRGSAQESTSVPRVPAEAVLSESQQQILTMFGWCLLQNGKIGPAVAALSVLHQIDPGRVKTMQLLCYASLKSTDYDTALKLSGRLLELARPEDARDEIVARLLKSRALWGLGRRDEARHIMLEAIARKREQDNDQSP